MLLVSTPFLIEQGASQYADVPLSFFYLATIIVFFAQDRAPEGSYRLVILAGMMAGLAAWTKNEGLLFLLSIASARFAVITHSRGWAASLKQMLRFAVGAAPITSIVILFKTHVGGPSEIFGGPGRSIAGSLVDFHRYTLIFGWLLGRVLLFGGWPFLFVPVLGVYVFLLGTRIDDRDRPSILTAVLALCMTLIGYALVFLIGPYDLQWWLQTSLDRLLLQLWPSAVFVFFLTVKAPEEALAEARNMETAQHLTCSN